MAPHQPIAILKRSGFQGHVFDILLVDDLDDSNLTSDVPPDGLTGHLLVSWTYCLRPEHHQAGSHKVSVTKAESSDDQQQLLLSVDWMAI